MSASPLTPADTSLLSLVDDYLQWELNPSYRQQVAHLRSSSPTTPSSLDSLRALFLPRIQFGTAGLRSRMAAGYHNIGDLVIIQSTQGILRYLQSHFGVDSVKTRGFIVGYDGRHNSRRYAELAAAVFLAEGVPVHLFHHPVATPLVSYAVKQRNTVGGVMITASHNPKEDNGYKVFWENSAQIIQPHDEGMYAQIIKNMKPWRDYNEEIQRRSLDNTLGCYQNAVDGALLVDSTDTLVASYMKDIVQYHYTSNQANESSTHPVTYTAMHGVGAPYTAAALKAFSLPPYLPVKEQIDIDPEFSTVKFPNPEEGKGALALSFATADKAQPRSNLVLANDPDADRLAVAERNFSHDPSDANSSPWNIFNGNEVALLFADYIWRSYKLTHPTQDPSKCVMISSTVSSKALKAMAKHEGFLFLGTLTGFKWMGNVAHDFITKGYEFLFAYEVEIGFLTGGISLDKDGVRMAALFNELAVSLYSQHSSCKDRLLHIYNRYGWYHMNTSYYFVYDRPVFQSIFNRIRYYDIQDDDKDGDAIIQRRVETDSKGEVGGKSVFYYPKAVGPGGKYAIASIRDISRGVDTSKPENRCILPRITDSFMITFRFTNGGTATLRNSGTEPKLKYYVEAAGAKSKEEAKEITDDMTKWICEEFIRPKKFGLKHQGE